MQVRCPAWLVLVICGRVTAWAWAEGAETLPATRPAVAGAAVPGEKVPSELEGIKDFHSLGLLEGKVNIFRSASPVRDLIKKPAKEMDDAAVASEAKARMARLHELGIRTIVSLESADVSDEKGAEAKAAQVKWVALEKTFATEAGIAFVSLPLSNAGPSSLETLTDGEVQKLLDQATTEILHDAQTGGVLFHCAAGHDRTGIVAAYLRLKYQHWPVDEAIAEMRRLGHNWVKYSNDGGTQSWHEIHLRNIADMLVAHTTSPKTADSK